MSKHLITLQPEIALELGERQKTLTNSYCQQGDFLLTTLWSSLPQCRYGLSVLEITVGYWPFSDQF